MSKKKKIVIIVSMALVLVIAAVLNVTLLTGKTTDKDQQTSVATSFFVTSKTDRQTTREYEISELNSILAMEGDEYADARKNAVAKKQDIVDAMETEMLLETLLKAQGFENVLVTVNASSDNVSVVVDKDELSREDTVRIYNVIASETAVQPEYVKILSV